MKDIEFLKKHQVDVEASLELFGDIETYNDTLKEFQSGIQNKVDQISKYYEEQDMPNYAIYVHSLKSDCKYFGFTKLADMAYQHELESKAGNISFVKENYKPLTKEIDTIIKLVNEYLGTTNTSSEASQTTGTKILVADDSEVIRSFVKKAVGTSYEVIFASDGEETLALIKESETTKDIAAILLDLNMPKLDGFSILEYIKEQDLFDTMPVSIISGDSSSEAINKAFEYPIIDMLNKPFSEDKIKDIVERTVNKQK